MRRTQRQPARARAGLTAAPIQPVDGWREAYSALFAQVAAELEGVASWRQSGATTASSTRRSA